MNGHSFAAEKFALPRGKFHRFRGGTVAVAGTRAAPAAPAGMAHLSPAQVQTLQAAALKPGMTLQQYHQHLLAQQRAKQAAAKKVG